MKTTIANERRRRIRLLPRFGVRSLVLVTLIVALLLVAIPSLERAGKIAYCDHYDMGKNATVHVPALGSASCIHCHRSSRVTISPWITLSPKYRIFATHVDSKVSQAKSP
jgi:hypothetical protein